MKKLSLILITLWTCASCSKEPIPGWLLLTPEERSRIEIRYLSPDGKYYTTDGKTYTPVGSDKN